MADADNNTDAAAKSSGPSWWDSWWALGFLIAAIFIARFYILEPYKIPSGSMEPTLIGHEDYGDRIVTNKLAYAPAKQVWMVLGGSVLFIAFGFLASKAWKSVKSLVVTVALLIAIVGGILFGWSKDAVASVPKRFEVVVFEYERAWEDKNEASKVRINYIKRLCGLPGETLVINGGDLFVRNDGKDRIIRKWQDAPEVQEQFWYLVAKAWVPTTHRQMSAEDRAKLAFPWTGAEAGKPGVKLAGNSFELDASAPVELSYAHRVTNVHIKQGRWLFRHVGCPAANKPGIKDENGITWRNPENAHSEFVRAYINHPWEGVQCPQCQQVIFPLELGENGLQPWQPGAPLYMRDANSGDENVRRQNSLPPEVSRFFYGGDDVVGDLKLELEIDVETGGQIELEVGSNLHAAHWVIGGDVPAGSKSVHPVSAATPALTPGRHTLKLAYLDGTVIAELDGRELARQLIEVEPVAGAADTMKSVARVKFSGAKARVTRLDLFRDLYYLPMLKGSKPNNRAADKAELKYGDLMNVIEIPRDHYLMMGDNAPSSSDSRIWGAVPRQNIVGRASFIWWPMSRWKTITHGHGEAAGSRQ